MRFKFCSKFRYFFDEALFSYFLENDGFKKLWFELRNKMRFKIRFKSYEGYFANEGRFLFRKMRVKYGYGIEGDCTVIPF